MSAFRQRCVHDEPVVIRAIEVDPAREPNHAVISRWFLPRPLHPRPVLPHAKTGHAFARDAPVREVAQLRIMECFENRLGAIEWGKSHNGMGVIRTRTRRRAAPTFKRRVAEYSCGRAVVSLAARPRNGLGDEV